MEIYVIIESSTYTGFIYNEWYVYQAFSDYDKAVSVAESLNIKAREIDGVNREYRVVVTTLKGKVK